MKKNFFKLMGKNILMGSMFSIGIILTIFGVFAFESLTTTPGTAGNQSLGSQILSVLPSGGFNRTTDSLEAIRTKLDLMSTTSGGGYFNKCQVKKNSTAIFPTCPTGFTSIHTYASARVMYYWNNVAGFADQNTLDNSWFYSAGSYPDSTYACTVCKAN